MLKDIKVKGARQHNLKNIDVNIPRDKFVVITGLSGSGKSTLAFDTIYAEGQRRYVESLSAYARQFLGMQDKPDVDSIEGLSPAISIEQKSTSKNPRSTVGTVTEIYDYLRLLFARIGIAHCPECNTKIEPRTPQNIAKTILSQKDKDLLILAPIVRGLKGTYEKQFEKLLADGFSRVRVDGELYKLDTIKDEVKLKRYEKHWIEAVVDRITINDDTRSRLSEAVERAVDVGEGTVITYDMSTKLKKSNKKEINRGVGESIYSTYGVCPNHPHIVFEALEPRHFSFNSPFGACSKCLGLGTEMAVSEDLVIPDKTKSILDGAIKVYGKMDLTWRARQLSVVGRKYGFNLTTPIEKFTPEQLDILLNGSNETIKATWHTGANMNMENGWEGIIPQTQRLYAQTDSEYRKGVLEKFMVYKPCPKCEGKRLKNTILSVKINDKSIIDITDMSIEKSRKFFKDLEGKLNEEQKYIGKQVLKEIKERLSFLDNVGLNYLTLSRSAKTLSGGEAQRIRLASQIGSNLMGVLYILDEPSIGLHQRDNEKLINTFHKLRDLGNTVLVVEHDEDTIRASDYVIDIGPGAGVHGGHIVATGTLQDIEKNVNSLTGEYLSGKKKIEMPHRVREKESEIILKGARQNNLKNIDVSFPTGVLCAITGVSGSGKSTLMNSTLIPAIKSKQGKTITNPSKTIGKYDNIYIPNEVKDVIVIDQSPIGKTPRSNPATYTKLFDDIRALFAQTKEAKIRGYKQGRFSFNVKGGRCEKCRGDGTVKIEMNFLPDVYIECSECKGKRYNKETLDIRYKGYSIADILDMSVDEAIEIFKNHKNILRKLNTLKSVGLGYIKLGQGSNTLSGGESQRIKITKELSKLKSGHTIYLLDEPTTGLHFEDIKKLIEVLNRLVDKDNSVYVIEHNLDVIKSADYVIDLGPEGGDKGGEIVAQGTPLEVSKIKKSHTGKFLRGVLK